MAATTTALAAAVLAVLALRPSSKAPTSLAARNPAVEVRTVVIRRTVHIVKHERAPGAIGPHGHGQVAVGAEHRPKTGASGSHSSRSGVAAGGAVSTRASGSHLVAGIPGSAPVTTRTSAAHGAPTSGAGSAAPVTTRTSAAHGGTPSSSGSRPVTTRTSAASGTSRGKPVSTRTSGSHGGDGEDGGDGSGGDN